MRLALLGATGSIGTSALDVARELGERVEVAGLSCASSWCELAALAEAWRPAAVAIADPAAAAEARAAGAFGPGVRVLEGEEGVAELAREVAADTVLNGIVGAAGLRATLAALGDGRRVALANKESLVVGGELVVAAAGGGGDQFGDPGARLLPVDSEHNAIWQLLEGRARASVRRIVLTASGGPFRGASRERLAAVDREEALAHPTWSMGPKITVDSATLANKGLEVIEAHWLFGLPYASIEVVVHPQSIVHGLIETVDGTLFAELGPPDMRAPIWAALTWPERVERRASGVAGSAGSAADLTALSGLTFEPPDLEAFPMLAIARAAGEAGGTAPAVYNAANEVAVAAFLEGRIGFPGIPRVVQRVLDETSAGDAGSLEALEAADREARVRAGEAVAGEVGVFGEP